MLKKFTSAPIMARQVQKFNFGIFDYFKKKTAAEEKAAVKVQESVKLETEIKIQKPQIPKSTDLKKEIQAIERTGDNNLYGKYQPIRKSSKQRNNNLQDLLHEQLQASSQVSIQKFESSEFKRGLQEADGEYPFPISPRLGPYEIKDPIFGAKNYYWCSCGMSKSQPFCDSSHAGTSFRPIKFSLDQKVQQMHICGCKLTKNAPFCDGETCKCLVSGDIDRLLVENQKEQ